MEKAVTADLFRFEFEPAVSLTDAEMSLHLALFAVEGLFGQARVRLEARYRLEAAQHAILVEGGTEVGAAVVQVFTSLALREFGETAFQVRRAPGASVPPPAPECQEPTEKPVHA